MTSHYLNQWWSGLLTHICVTWPHWVKWQHLSMQHILLTHWRLVIHICEQGSEMLSVHCQSHYLGHWWPIINWTLGNKLQWPLNQNTPNIFQRKCISRCLKNRSYLFRPKYFNTSPPGQNSCHFADNIFRCIFVNEKFCILIEMSLKFVPKGSIDNNLALVHIMACHRIGAKPLSEPMLTRFTHAFMQHKGEMS